MKSSEFVNDKTFEESLLNDFMKYFFNHSLSLTQSVFPVPLHNCWIILICNWVIGSVSSQWTLLSACRLVSWSAGRSVCQEKVSLALRATLKWFSEFFRAFLVLLSLWERSNAHLTATGLQKFFQAYFKRSEYLSFTFAFSRDGNDINLYHVLEKPDGSYSPLSDSWSGSSIR